MHDVDDDDDDAGVLRTVVNDIVIESGQQSVVS